ncbi:contractile injection system tape measure protein [Algoriphagus marincola]|uniref:contractile injection system tape measure protein n=1 Tax=Algoriphagus marincola TaxID=264027 RepID=UPI00041FCACF|nr:contractile injection system tape measure protein [Algoriphagus marincola]
MSRHVIHTQRLELDYKNEEYARTDQNRWAAIYEQELLPVIEEVFDDHERKGIHLRITKLDLNLGRISPSLDLDILRDRLKKKLIDELSISADKKAKGNGIESPDNSEIKTDEDSEKQNTWELFIHLLQYGVRPWWATYSGQNTLKKTLQKLLESEDSKLLAFLNSKEFTMQEWERLKNSLDFQTTYELLSLYSPHFSGNVRRIHSLFKKLLVNQWLSLEKLEEHLIHFLLLEFRPIASDTDLELRKYSSRFFKNDSGNESDFFIHLMAWLLAKNNLSFQSQEIERVAEELLKKGLTLGLFRKKQSTSVSKKVLLQRFIHAYQQYSKKPNNLISEKITGPSVDDEAVFTVSNAGLVLLAPFLKHFFAQVGYLSEKEFKNHKSQYQAALLLQFLLNPSTEYAEEELILNKILCGIPLHDPIPVKAEFSDFEKVECRTLLDSVAHHWSALKSTSGDFMAKGFLPRKGSIRPADGGFKLQIERLSIDILVDRLPWAISIIKLPWMDQTLITEW